MTSIQRNKLNPMKNESESLSRMESLVNMKNDSIANTKVNKCQKTKTKPFLPMSWRRRIITANPGIKTNKV